MKRSIQKIILTSALALVLGFTTSQEANLISDVVRGTEDVVFGAAEVATDVALAPVDSVAGNEPFPDRGEYYRRRYYRDKRGRVYYDVY